MEQDLKGQIKIIKPKETVLCRQDI